MTSSAETTACEQQKLHSFSLKVHNINTLWTKTYFCKLMFKSKRISMRLHTTIFYVTLVYLYSRQCIDYVHLFFGDLNETMNGDGTFFWG